MTRLRGAMLKMAHRAGPELTPARSRRRCRCRATLGSLIGLGLLRLAVDLLLLLLQLFTLFDELDRVLDVLGALARALDGLGVSRLALGLADELPVLHHGLLERGHGLARVTTLGLVLLRQDRLVVVGLGAVGLDLLALRQVLACLGEVGVGVRVV